MSAIPTKKPNADSAVQLTFPSVYQSVYNIPLRYAPTAMGPFVAPMAGDDFQSHYHAQKKIDADRMARAKVASTSNAQKRMLLSHQNYFGMPAPHLSQREFANPTAGSYIVESARRTNTTAPYQLIEVGLTGGVLRTAEGQAYGKARLVERVKQLDTIDAEKMRFTGVEPPTAPFPEAPTTSMAPVSQNAKVELQLLLKAIIDTLMGGMEGQPGEKDELSRFTFGDSVRALSLVIRVASSPDTDAETLEDIKAPIDSINQLLSGLTDPDRMEQVETTPMAKERLITTAELFERIGEYIDGMMGGVNLSPRDRQSLSKNLVKSLGFTKFARDMENQRVESRGFYEKVSRSKLFDTRGRQAMDDEDDDDDDKFNLPATPREESEQSGSRSANFDDDERQVFGYASGQWFGAPRMEGREAPTFLGEERPAMEDLGRSNAAAPARTITAPSNISSEIRSVYDPVLGARGVEVRRAPSLRGLPSRQAELPTTREGFDALAKAINEAGGIDGKPIQVYSKGSLTNVRRNFIRRLGLQGKP